MEGPIYVDWAITNVCNLNCRHCTGMSQDELDHDEAIEVAEDIIQLSPRWVIIEGGEPLMREDFEEIGKRIKDDGIEVYIITNGNAFTPGRLRSLKSFSPKVMFSFDGSEENLYEWTKHGANFGTAVNWAERCSEEGFFQGITTVLSKLNFDHLEDFIVLTEDLGGESITFLPLKPFGEDDLSREYYHRYSLSPQEQEWAVERIYDYDTDLDIFYDEPFLWNLASEYGFSISKDSRGITIPDLEGCAASHSLYIQADGDVRPCMFSPEELSFGNASREPLQDVWRRMRRSRTLEVWQDQSLREGACGECSQFESCRGCLARTMRLMKDKAGSDPCCPLTPQSP
ncbi:hypothetical protein AKJ57_02165 [candidate division MSBL1 archaeon SCGC-AAA259A05]|uniref:Radical SAM core domain-containing protein n=1 Tax=candidate division MSBL1 archaeon SCGC-AAA259A05 TaxID=1698259 RepID=A0A133UAD8_9EURY|nr:hypothetical protein AKJ57_02165 [candidate division MSBL1 archaeon SCGC-AAA259A05]